MLDTFSWNFSKSKLFIYFVSLLLTGHCLFSPVLYNFSIASVSSKIAMVNQWAYLLGTAHKPRRWSCAFCRNIKWEKNVPKWRNNVERKLRPSPSSTTALWSKQDRGKFTLFHNLSFKRVSQIRPLGTLWNAFE